MANAIKLKRSSVAGKAPQPADLAYGELAVNTADSKVYLKNSANSVIAINDWANIHNKPATLSDAYIQSIRDIAITGAAVGWNYSWADGTADQPTWMYWTKGTEVLRINCAWETTGPSAGNLTSMVLSYSSNSGTDYTNAGTQSFVYDVNGDLTSTTWS